VAAEAVAAEAEAAGKRRRAQDGAHSHPRWSAVARLLGRSPPNFPSAMFGRDCRIGTINQSRQTRKVSAMEIQVAQDARITIRVSGEVDLSNVGDLRTALDSSVKESPGGFVVDLTEVGYIDSAGIAAIMAAYQGLRPSGGRLVLVVTNENVREILALIHSEELPGLFICDDMSTAERIFSIM